MFSPRMHARDRRSEFWTMTAAPHSAKEVADFRYRLGRRQVLSTFRAEPGAEDVLLRIASAYEATSKRRITPPAFGPLS
jgi:hypothetical protein